jgi:hypothetical protein
MDIGIPPPSQVAAAEALKAWVAQESARPLEPPTGVRKSLLERAELAELDIVALKGSLAALNAELATVKDWVRVLRDEIGL